MGVPPGSGTRMALNQNALKRAASKTK